MNSAGRGFMEGPRDAASMGDPSPRRLDVEPAATDVVAYQAQRVAGGAGRQRPEAEGLGERTVAHDVVVGVALAGAVAGLALDGRTHRGRRRRVAGGVTGLAGAPRALCGRERV